MWNDFKEIVNSAFGKLRCDEEFTEVILVCEAGQQMDAHKVILVSSSPFFENILQKSKHSHPLQSFDLSQRVSVEGFFFNS